MINSLNNLSKESQIKLAPAQRSSRRTAIPMHLHIGCTLALLVGSSRALVTPGSSGRLLVCGGSGFLGREVCREAVARGWAVTSLSRRGVNPEPGSTLDAVKVTLTVDA